MNNSSPAHTDTTVFYDGLCPICSREVRLYRTLDTCRRVKWLDIRDPATLAAEAFSLQAALELLHVRDAQGKLFIGMPAHLQMWAQLPYFRHLSALLRTMPALCRVLDKAYIFFTRYRPGRRRAGEQP